MTDYKQLCAELAEYLSLLDEPPHELVVRAQSALAELEPEGPTDEKLLKLTQDWPCTTGERHDLSGCPEVPLFSVFEDELVEFARAVLARWGNHPAISDSSPQSIPVSERLPGVEDCDAQGMCWWWYPEVPGKTYGYWAHEDDAVPERALGEQPSHWLPAHALPVPSYD